MSPGSLGCAATERTWLDVSAGASGHHLPRAGEEPPPPRVVGVGVAPPLRRPRAPLLLLLLLLLGVRLRRSPSLAASLASASASSRSASSASTPPIHWRAAATARRPGTARPARRHATANAAAFAPPPTTHHAGVRRCASAAAESPGAGRRTPAWASSEASARQGLGGRARGSRRGRRARAGRGRPTTRTRGGTRGGPGRAGPARTSAPHRCCACTRGARGADDAPRRRGGEDVDDVDGAEELVRDFVSRRDGEGGGAGDGTPARVPHVDVPGARAREHRLPVVAHAHARERGRGVLGAASSARGAPPAHRASHRTPSLGGPTRRFWIWIPRGRTASRRPSAGGAGAGRTPRSSLRAVPRRARVNNPGGAPGGDVDDLDRVGVARRRRHVQAVARPREARERPRDAPAVAEAAPGEDGAYRSPSDSLRMSVRNAPRKPLAVATASVEPQAGKTRFEPRRRPRRTPPRTPWADSGGGTRRAR